MTYVKRLGLVCAAIAFLISISAVSGFAQRTYRDRSWESRDYNRQYNQNRRYYRRGSRMTPWEYRRMMRQRARYYRRANRYYSNDGYLSYRERRRLARRNYQYRRNIYQYRRNW
jgi:hypothetical protein